MALAAVSGLHSRPPENCKPFLSRVVLAKERESPECANWAFLPEIEYARGPPEIYIEGYFGQ